MQKITSFLWFDGNAEAAMMPMDKIGIAKLRQACQQ